jgi:hypothetical protein
MVVSTSAHRRFVFAYGAAFALFYAIARARGLALFTVYPAQGIVLLGAIVPGMLPIRSWISSRPRCIGTDGLLLLRSALS